MDHELKQRLIGAVVVTALAAIFIPMLFDDPVDTSGKTVTELTIPQAPAEVAPETAQNIPANKDQALDRPEIELNAAEVNEDNQANATGEAPATNIPDGEQTVQPSIADTAKDSGSGLSDNEPSDGLPLKQSDQNGVSGLDTGDVQGANQLEDSQGNAVSTTETVKKPEQNLEKPTKKPASKPIVSEKPKVKSVVTAEKAKVVTKTQKEPVKKSSSKLVRYSIQAGSFNKKENAQSLVDKLRKQGMPASLSAKGEYFRVKIGPSLDKDKAKEMKAKLDKQNIKGLLVSE
jgi:DedD protein